MNYKRLVAGGYDAIAGRLAAEPYPSEHVPQWLRRLAAPLHRGARVLDLGCGSGMPHTAWLAERYQVIGVDISRRQLQIAQKLVPDADFVQADMCALSFPPAYFNAVVAIYSIIHVPREEQAQLVKSISGWLRPSGRALLVLGAEDTPIGLERDFFGAPMYWSHFDSRKSLQLLHEAGLQVLAAGVEADTLDPKGGHLFVLCLR